MLSFLDTDNSKSSKLIFTIAALLLCIIALVVVIRSHGCEAYGENLKSCTPFKCSQKVMGFENRYGGNKGVMLTREIVGLEQDPYFNSSTCHTIETIADKQVTCKYSPKTAALAASRAEVLFGTVPAPLSATRASYAELTKEQAVECK